MSTKTETISDKVLGLSSRQWMILLVLLAVALLELLPRLGLVNSFTLPPVSTMFMSAGELLTERDFWAEHMMSTFSSVIIAFVIASLLGILIGIAVWHWEPVREALDPWLSIYYAIPTFALYPILVVLVGVGVFPVTLLAILLAIVSVVTATLDGLDATPKTILRLSDSLELTWAQQMFKILLPSAFRQIFVGLRLAVSFSIIGVMASEFILSTKGLGYFISYAYDHFALQRMYGAILIVLLVAIIANFGIATLITRRERKIYG